MGITSIGYIWLTAQAIASLYAVFSMLRSYRAQQVARHQ